MSANSCGTKWDGPTLVRVPLLPVDNSQLIYQGLFNSFPDFSDVREADDVGPSHCPTSRYAQCRRHHNHQETA